MLIRTMLAASLAATVLAVAMPTPSFSQAAPVIAERKAGFKRMEGALEAIDTLVKARGPVAGAVSPARVIAEHAPKIVGLFPAGSDQGDTKARPTIWSDRAGFEKVAADFATQANLLLAVAESGDAARLQSTLQDTGRACTACHRGYRAR